MPVKTVMTTEDMRRTLSRIAHEIVERTRDIRSVVLVGMQTRGVPLANRLASLIADYEKVQVPVGALDFSLYRDDLGRRNFNPQVKSTEIPVGIEDKVVVLVDDVLFTGRSTRAAMDALIEYGRPRVIQLAVLVDRGHRQLPIRADYVGKNIPSSTTEDIRVKLTETDGGDEVVISSGE